MELRKINTKDIEAQWAYTTALPADENGLTNPYNGVSFEEYKEKVLPTLISYEHPVNMPDWFVPETYYYLWDGDCLVGEFRIRHYLTEALRNGAGHIGYSISKVHRGKGYGTEGLRLTLQIAKEIVPEDEIYLRVYKDNIASQKVMMHNGAYRAGEDEEHYFMRVAKEQLPERLERTTIYESDYVCLYSDRVKLPSGQIIEKYHQIHYPHDAVVIVIFNDKDEILMIREKRYTVGRLEWEVPAGRVEAGETNEEAARREAMEESGCTLKDLKFLCSFNSANGMSDHLLHLYGAQVNSEASIQDVDEVAYKVWMHIAKVKEMLKNNESKDGVSIMAILYALQFYEY